MSGLIAIEAEAVLLGCLFHEPRLLDAARAAVQADHFASEAHRWVWRALCDLSDEGAGVDVLAVADWLNNRPGDVRTEQTLLDVCGGPSKVARMASAAASSTQFEGAMRIVCEHNTRRLLRSVLAAATEQLVDGAGSSDVIAGLNSSIASLQPRALGGDESSWASTIASQVMRDLEAGDDMLARISTNVPPLDELLGGGIAIGMHTIIGAMSGHGKTTIASAAIAGLLKHNAVFVDWYGCEVPRKPQFCRIASSWAGVDETFWRQEDARTEADYKRAVEALGWGKDLQSRLRIEHWPRIQMRDVALNTAVRRRAIGDAPLIVVVDYLQRATAGDSTKAHERIAEASAMLAGLADERTATIAMSQFTTEASGEPIPLPKPGHARWAKDIENDACDFVVYHRPLKESVPNLALLQLAKSRYGRLAHAWAIGTPANRFGWAREFASRYDSSLRIPENMRGLHTTEVMP